MINYILIAHLLGATIWTGGHLILSLIVLPKALKTEQLAGLMAFEEQFEKIGMPALILQIITGLWMVYRLLPEVSLWFGFDNDLSTLITLKITLLALTVLVALHARFRVIPTLSPAILGFFALHIVAVTLLSVSFVIVGSLFRTGLS